MSRRAIEGVGLGLRLAFVDELLARSASETAPLGWLECHPENYMRRGGRFPDALEKARARWPFATHGLSLSLGGVDPLDRDYLARVDAFVRAIEAPWHSDHLCFSTAHGASTHDLLPLPRTEEMVRHVASRVRQAQDRLSIPLAVENVSTYVDPPGSTMSEAAFVRAIVEESKCGLMLDVNNVFVNAFNFGFDARAAIAAMPLERVVQIHVAGHDEEAPDLLVDTHAAPVREEVYDLLAFTLARTGPVPVLLERDDDFPTLDALLDEVRRLDAIVRAVPTRAAAHG